MVGLNDSFKVVFENNNFLVIDKENNISTQQNNHYQESVEQKLRKIGSPYTLLPRCGIVHRLDKNTTGLLLIAKSIEYFKFLTKLFKESKIQKNYLSLHKGKPSSERGEISFFLKKAFVKNKRVKMKLDHLDGKLVKIYYSLVSTNNNFSLLNVNPITGRTHQIRLAFQSINFPIYNDNLYNDETLLDDSNGQYLHAFSLNFYDKKKKFEFTAKLPDFFEKKILSLGLFLNLLR